jgi:hypothetical protein
MAEVNECLIIGFDRKDGDKAVMVVAKQSNSVIEFVNMLINEEALLMYQKLTNRSVNPITPKAGQVYHDTDSDSDFIFNKKSWGPYETNKKSIEGESKNDED